uniref:hypothetical protein n=1 Tax=uncultured Caulobacter sp. TaxID=158749 RepID=UPI0025DC6318|nr:hypothetical protein [uncultured Caulobacter sp.]
MPPLARQTVANHLGLSPTEPFVGGLRSPKREAEFLGVPVLKRRRRVSGSSNAAAFPYLIQAGG